MISGRGDAEDRPSRALLVGAGHAHLEIIRRAGEFARRGHELVLVAPEPFWYSGLATGMLGGLYPPELDQVDVGAVVTRAGGRFLQDRVIAIDVGDRTVHLESGSPLRYEALSLNLGSEVPTEAIPGLAEHGVAVKPIRNLWELRRDLVGATGLADRGAQIRVVVIGGGATGCEVAGNLARLAAVHSLRVEITVLVAGDRILSGWPRGAARDVEHSLRRRDVRIEVRSAVVCVKPGVAITENGRTIGFDRLVAATGLRPSPLLRETGLPTDAEGALLVDEHLRSIGDPRVHGGGDCVAWKERPLAKVGVYAVREAPFLHYNLLAALEQRPPKRFRPQRRFLLILNLGDGTGLARWGQLSWHGRLAFRLKDHIDRKFLGRYQSLLRSSVS